MHEYIHMWVYFLDKGATLHLRYSIFKLSFHEGTNDDILKTVGLPSELSQNSTYCFAFALKCPRGICTSAKYS